MSLNWNEIRVRAKTFAQDFQDAHYEKGETQTFYNEFFNIFGIKRRQVARFEEHIRKLDDRNGFIDLFWPKVLLVEQKSAGRDLAKAADQAGEYFDAIRDKDKPRFQLLCDFQTFELLDRGTRENWSFTLAELPEKVDLFAFMLGREKRKFVDQDPVNIEASELMGVIHDELKASGYLGHNLEAYLVRLLFMLFADDTGIFEPRDTLFDVIENRTHEDGSDLGMWLHRIFEILDTPEDQRNANLDEDLDRFPYVNGDLFAKTLPTADFSSAMRDKFLEACRFNWSAVSPAIFGSLFQSVMEPAERRAKGAHYTSEKNIMKVIGPLFLDDLRTEFERLKQLRRGRAGQLEAFRLRLGTLTFLDPACGCGNFLVIAYRELRQLEIDVLDEIRGDGQMELDAGEFGLSVIDVDQFYGIELEEFPARIAEVAMWMIDHIMNNRMSLAFGQIFTRIPLTKSPHIHHGDALEIDWNDVLPAHQCSYVLGNPPFVGQSYQSPKQRLQMKVLVDPAGRRAGSLDYVAAWFIKAGEYVADGRAEIAFVATNSITQGEQVAQLWPILFDRHKLEISFAHQTFEWGSEARGKAHVHVVITGLTRRDMEPEIKRIFSYDDIKGEPEESRHIVISPYLFGGESLADPHIVVQNAPTPLSPRPQMIYGSKPTDGGNLILSPEERAELISEHPEASVFIKRLVGAHDAISGTLRYCLWLTGVEPSQIKSIPVVLERVRKVKEFRLVSPKIPTQRDAERAWEFAEIRHTEQPFICVPRHTSERRDYLPLGFFDGKTIAHDSCLFIPGSTSAHFAILTSAMHMAWLRNIGGRLKSDYRYSIGLVYNTFPWPNMSDKAKEKIGGLGQAILDARDQFPDATLADLYDPDLIPPVLRKAHQANDRAVDRLYRAKPFDSERERVEHLFELYEKMVAPVEAAAKAKPKPRRKQKEPRK